MKALRALAWLTLAFGLLALGGIVSTWAPDRPVATLEARWAPPPSSFVSVNGLRVHYRDEGPHDDPLPIVLLHGTSASLHTWEAWAAALHGSRRVITFDLPGFGLTGPNAEGDYRPTTYVRFVLDVLDALKVPRFVLGGNSLGGAIAWQTAVAWPQRVSQLILIDAGGYPMTSQSIPLGFRLARIPVLNRLMANVLPRGVVESSLRNLYGHPERVTPELVDRYVAMTLRDGNRRALVQRLEQTNWGEGADGIATLRMPTLIIWGGRDRLIPPDHATQFATNIPGSTLVVFDDLGHVPQEEDPARTLVAVQRFLAMGR